MKLSDLRTEQKTNIETYSNSLLEMSGRNGIKNFQINSQICCIICTVCGELIQHQLSIPGSLLSSRGNLSIIPLQIAEGRYLRCLTIKIQLCTPMGAAATNCSSSSPK